MSTDKPDAGEPVEPTGEDLIYKYMDRSETSYEQDATDIFQAGRAFERASRERKRGDRPVDAALVEIGWAACGGEVALKRALEAGDYDEADRLGHLHDRGVFDAGIAYAESGDSDELAKLRAEISDPIDGIAAMRAECRVAKEAVARLRAEATDVRAAFGLSPNDIATGAHARDLCRCLSEFGTRARLAEAERDAEKARADRAEAASHEWRQHHDALGEVADAQQKELTKAKEREERWRKATGCGNPESAFHIRAQAKARIAELETVLENTADVLGSASRERSELESVCRERLQEMANRDGRIAELEAESEKSKQIAYGMGHTDATRCLTKELAEVREHRDLAYADLRHWQEAHRLLAGELAEVREELRLNAPLVAFARNSRWTAAGSAADLDAKLKALDTRQDGIPAHVTGPCKLFGDDAHRAKTSGSAEHQAAKVATVQSAEPELPTQSPSSARDEYLRGKRAGLTAARGYLFDEDGDLHDKSLALQILLKEFDREITKLESPSSADSGAHIGSKLDTAHMAATGEVREPPTYETAPTLEKWVRYSLLPGSHNECEIELTSDGTERLWSRDTEGGWYETVYGLRRVVRVESAPVSALPADGEPLLPKTEAEVDDLMRAAREALEPRKGFVTAAELAEVVRRVDVIEALVAGPKETP